MNQQQQQHTSHKNQDSTLQKKIDMIKNFSKSVNDAMTKNQDQCLKLLQAQLSDMRSFVDSLMTPPLSHLLLHKKFQRDVLKKCGGLCWNACVAYSSSSSSTTTGAPAVASSSIASASKGNEEKSQNGLKTAPPMYFQVIQLRILACDLIMVGWLESDDQVNYGIKRNVKVVELLSRIGREWSNVGELEKCEQYLKMATMHVEKICSSTGESINSVVLSQEERRMIINNAMIFRIENLWKGGSQELALATYRNIKSLIRVIVTALGSQSNTSMVDDELNRLAHLTFNFAVDLHEKSQYQEAIEWLRESLELFEISSQYRMQSGGSTMSNRMVDQDEEEVEEQIVIVDVEAQARHARVLRLMSSCYIELHNYESALTCCQMANDKCKNHSGLYLMTKIYFMMDREKEARSVMMEAVHSRDTPINVSLSLCQMGAQYKAYSLVEQAYQRLIELHVDSPSDASTSESSQLIILAYVEYLLQTNESDTSGGGITRAREVLDTIISKLAKNIIVMNKDMMKNFHVLVWNQAVVYYEQKDFANSITWFQYAIKLLPMDDSFNRAKILRFMSRCYLQLKKPQDAEQVASDAESLDPNSQQTMYEFFKIALQMKDVVKATIYLKKMMEAEDFQVGVFALAAHDAHEAGCDLIALEALETLLSPKSNINSKEKGPILRNICLLCKQLNDVDKLLHYLKVTMEVLYAVGVKDMFKKNHDEEIEWFYVLSWNTALLYGRQHQDWERAYLLLKFTTDFARYRQFSIKVIETQRNCMLMRVFCLLKMSQVLNSVFNQQESNHKLELMMHEIATCKQYSEKIKEIKRRNVSEDANMSEYDKLEMLKKIEDDKSMPLLLLCEYQCKILLRCEPSELARVLDEARKEPAADAKLFRLFAYMISSENCSSAIYTDLANDVLKFCIQKGMESKIIDLKSIINLHRLWIDGCKLREDSYAPYESLYTVLSDHYKSEYDENDAIAKLLKLLITKAWNNSVYFFKLFRLEKSEQWMALCLKMINLFQLADHQSAISTELNELTKIITNGYHKLLENIQQGQRQS